MPRKDAVTYSVQPHVPFPEYKVYRKKNNEPKYPLKYMNVGDSFLVPFDESRTPKDTQVMVMGYSNYWRKMNNSDWKFASRKMLVENGIRVWRIA